MMKNIITILLVVIFLSPITSFGQDSIGYWAGNVDNKLSNMDLSDASKTLIGTTVSNIIAGDFGTDNKLLAISNNNGFYEIDTIDGSYTLLGTNPPPLNHAWSGLAYDDASGIMYGCSAWSVASGESSIYTIDETDGSYTLIGSQGTANTIGCIAIDNTGQMYGLNETANAKIYLIDKTDGSVTELGPIGQGAAGMGHAMDFDTKSETMYLSTYNSISFANTLRIVNLTNGSTTEVGDVNSWTGLFAARPLSPLTSDFSADNTTPCKGSAVHFTDESQGATSWSWTFEAGLPSSSAYQHPTVIYKIPGTYNVELTTSNGSASETETKEDYIDVVEEPTPVIKGPSAICKEEMADYATTENAGSTYKWTVMGGEITAGDSTTHQITVLWGAPGNGTIDLVEKASGTCEGTAETFEVTIDDCVGFEDIGTVNLKIYPNPAKDQITIQSERMIISLRIVDVTGREVLSEKTLSKSFKLNTSTLKPGIYLLLIETEETTVNKRIVIE